MTHQEIMEEYRLTREKNTIEQERRTEEVRAKNALVRTLMDERHNMILQGARNAFSNTDAGDLESIMHGYNARIRYELEKMGYPSDYLQPIFACATCKDTGYQGEIVRTICNCYRQKALAHAETVGGEIQTFESFNLSVFPAHIMEEQQVSQRALMDVIRAFCENYADKFPVQKPSDLLLYGGSGLGKSFLLSCICNRVKERGHTALFISAYQMLNQLRQSFFKQDGQSDLLFETELLLIDDLGIEPLMANITLEQIFHLFNERRNRNLATVFTTNLTLTELKKRYTERISSRLLDSSACRVFHLMGQDIRTLRK